MKKVLVSTLFFNQVESSKRFIHSLLSYTDERLYDLAILNNGSTDETEKYCQGLNKIIYYKMDENIGFPRGHNYIIEKNLDNYDYVLIANNDIELTKEWLDKMLEYMKTYDIVAPVNRVREKLVIGGKLLDKDGKGEYVYVGDKKNIDWLQFSCVLIKKQVFKKIGLLDEGFGLGYYEDVDFCLRAREYGYKLGIANDTTIIHYDGVTSKQLLSKDKIMEKSRQFFCKKWNNYLNSL